MYSKKLLIGVIIIEVIMAITSYVMGPLIDSSLKDGLIVGMMLIPILFLLAIIGTDQSISNKKRLYAIGAFVFLLVTFILASIGELAYMQ